MNEKRERFEKMINAVNKFYERHKDEIGDSGCFLLPIYNKEELGVLWTQCNWVIPYSKLNKYNFPRTINYDDISNRIWGRVDNIAITNNIKEYVRDGRYVQN